MGIQGVIHPGASTDNAVPRSNGETGSILKSSSVSIDDSGNITVGNAKLTAQSSDPSMPAAGTAVLWVSDGTGTGDAGDLLVKDDTGAVKNLSSEELGNITVGDASNRSPTDPASGHLVIDGAGYDGYITLDATGMYIGHDSSSRSIRFQTNATDRVVISNTGDVTFKHDVTLDGDLSVSGSLGDVAVGGGTNITPTKSGVGQLVVDGAGYFGYIAMDATAMHIGHTSSSRAFHLQTNETDRITIAGNGDIAVKSDIEFESDVTFTGQLQDIAMGAGTNISPNSSGDGQLTIAGAGYRGYVALDGTAMYFGHHSSGRGLHFQTNERDRITVAGNGAVAVKSDIELTHQGSTPSTPSANNAKIYASSGEMKVLDDAGNETTISPHDKDGQDAIYNESPGVESVVGYRNHYRGEIRWVNHEDHDKETVVETFEEYNARRSSELEHRELIARDWDAEEKAAHEKELKDWDEYKISIEEYRRRSRWFDEKPPKRPSPRSHRNKPAGVT